MVKGRKQIDVNKSVIGQTYLELGHLGKFNLMAIYCKITTFTKQYQTGLIMNGNALVLVAAVVLVYIPARSIASSEEELDDVDPYKTTDPKKREPSPCESRLLDCFI